MGAKAEGYEEPSPVVSRALRQGDTIIYKGHPSAGRSSSKAIETRSIQAPPVATDAAPTTAPVPTRSSDKPVQCVSTPTKLGPDIISAARGNLSFSVATKKSKNLRFLPRPIVLTLSRRFEQGALSSDQGPEKQLCCKDCCPKWVGKPYLAGDVPLIPGYIKLLATILLLLDSSDD